MTAVEIRAGEAALVLEPDGAGRLRQIGFRTGQVERGAFPPEAFPLAYPTWGDGSGSLPALRALPALRVTHHDGVTSTRLVVEGAEHSVAGAGEDEVVRVRLVDALEALTVTLCVRVFAAEQIFEQWAEICHEQPGPAVLHEVAAAAPVVVAPEPWLTHYGGDWAAEWATAEERLGRGVRSLESYGVVRPHLELSPFFLLSPAGRSAEERGQVLSGALAWGGAARLAFGIGYPADRVRLWCGHAPTGAEYTLEPGVDFVTPSVFWAWSATGRRSLTHRWHRFVREHVVRDGRRLRSVVLDTWEALGFHYDEAMLGEMIAGAGRLGAETFLLDDGWFGDEHPRRGEGAGLGDWVADPARLPGGLERLAGAARSQGVRLGIWVEPEMVSPASRCYAERPAWVVAQPGRERLEERHQLMLDICQPGVREFALAAVRGVIEAAPGVSLLKWDANRDVTEPGSPALPPERQGNFFVDTVRARWGLMSDVAREWPDVEVMLCASGGGRTDLGTLRYAHEVWLSDNTGAEERLRMQWAASHFLPPQVIGAHVTRWGDQELGFAAPVALGGCFGLDLDPATLDAGEELLCRQACAWYRQVRDLVQLGDLYRLVSPESGDGTRAALMHISAGADRAVVFAYQLPAPAPARRSERTLGARPGRLVLAGLDRARRYQVCRVELAGSFADDGAGAAAVRSGAELLDEGLAWPLTAPATAAIWELYS